MSPKKSISGDVVTGRGIALGTRNGTYVGTIAEVEVNRKTGVVKVTRIVCSHDCGLIVNPDALKSTIAANLVQSLGRTTKEEVMFDRSSVTSVDWNSYKVARASDVPAVVDIVLINRPDLPPGGAGEPSSRADRGRHRERRVRCHRRACPEDSAHAGKRQGGAHSRLNSERRQTPRRRRRRPLCRFALIVVAIVVPIEPNRYTLLGDRDRWNCPWTLFHR